ncbi:MAG: transcription-repair coupling factor, partial [Gammaproteobacteria bacterium]
MPTTFLETPAPDSTRKLRVGQLYGSSRGLLLSEQISRFDGLSVVVCCDMSDAEQLEQEIRFFSLEAPRVYRFPDLETLPYDQFSPHQDIVSERIQCLASISGAKSGVLILPVSTLMQKVSPAEFIHQRSLNLQTGDRIDPVELRERLALYGYSSVSQVEQHGEFSTRGSIMDLFPMGSPQPFRIDFFDDEVESIRRFDAESQRSIDRIDEIRLLPAQEYPLDEEGIKRFRLYFRETFDIDPNTCPVYVDISAGSSSPGVEYYLPLFFDRLVSLFDYLPQQSRLLIDDAALTHANGFAQQVEERYESRRYNLEWPLLQPAELFLDTTTLQARIDDFPNLLFSAFKLDQPDQWNLNCDTQSLPQLTLQPTAAEPDQALRRFIEKPAFDRILFSTESAGRREFVSEMLHQYGIHASPVESWGEFLRRADNRYYITASALQSGMTLTHQGLAVITENQLFGERAVQRRRRRYRKTRDAESTIQSLADLQPGAPVVHEDHGVGR